MADRPVQDILALRILDPAAGSGAILASAARYLMAANASYRLPNGGRGPLKGPWPGTLGEPNPYGLYGIAANVHEWCADWFASDDYRGSPDHQPAGR